QKGYLTRVVENFSNLKYINQGQNGWTAGNIAQNIDSLNLIKADVYSVFLGTNDWWAGRPVGKFDDYKNAIGNISVYGSYRIIIDKIRKLNPQAEIVLITPLQRNDFVYMADYKNNAHGSYKNKNEQSLEDFANAVIEISKKEGFGLVNLYNNPKLKIEKLVNFKRLIDPKTGKYVNYKYPTSIDIPFNPETDEYPYPVTAINMTYDGLHPSDKGNAVIAKEVVDVFRQLGL